MAGGTWKVQNKIRPGAYLDFASVKAPNSTLAERGVATMPLVMDWGPEGALIEVLSSDLVDGASLPKIGYTAADAESLLFRLCLGNCYKLLAWRVNGGAKAALTLGNLELEAKYSGQRGNQIAVAVLAHGAAFDVVTYLAGAERDRQTVTAIAELTDNDWVCFGGSGALTAAAATLLADGANGVIAADAYTNYFNALKTQTWQVMGIPSADAALPPLLRSYIIGLRENEGRKVQGVCYNYLSDHEGLIASKQGYTTGTETVSPVDFVAWVTGVSAGCAVDESNTYRLIQDAQTIVGELTDAQIKEALGQGWFVISKRTDGKIIVEQDRNTLVSYVTGEKDKSFAKNRVVRTLDEIGNSIALMFELHYIGKVDNDAAGRDLFKADIISYCRTLEAISAIQNFDGESDVIVTAGAEADSVLVTLGVQPVDSMEKLYMTVEVG